MSDYLRAPVIIQRDLNLPAALWFDGSAHSLGVEFLACQMRADHFSAYLLRFQKKKHARCERGTHVDHIVVFE